MANSLPRLTDHGIVLRPLAADDVEELSLVCDYEGFCLLQNTDQSYGVDQENQRRESIRYWASRHEQAWLTQRFDNRDFEAVFALRLVDESQLAGVVAFQYVEDEVLPSGLNVAFWTMPSYRRQRIATRGVELGVPWGFANWHLEYAYIHATNTGSVAVATTCEFQRTIRSVGESVIYARPVPPGCAIEAK